MIPSPLAAITLVLTVVGMLAPGDASSLLIAAAAAVLVVAAAALAVTTAASGSNARRGVHPRRSIDVSAPLDQSDPDAPGRRRPRAPGLAAAAA